MSDNSTTCSTSTAAFLTFPNLSESSNAKRTRTACWNVFDGDGGDVIRLPFSRHKDLWFSDGSVVLRAEQTLFRVHMSQLSRHSAFFRDLFSLPQPPKLGDGNDDDDDDGELPAVVEGCPVLRLHDSAEDLGHLLMALYDGPTLGDNSREDFKVVSGILRLSTKYLIDSLRAKSLAHLSIAWPSSLKCWDVREDRARMFELETGISRGHFYPSPIAVISLAREVNATALLPSALYDLSRYHYNHIFEPAKDDPLYPPPTSSSTHKYRILSHSDMQNLCLGKECASHFITSLIQSMALPSPSSSITTTTLLHTSATTLHPTIASHRRRPSSKPGEVCISAAACRKDFSELVDLATQHYIFDREKGCADPLYVAEELGQLKSAEFSECVACARSLEAWAAKERDRIWKLLPAWFRLDIVSH